MTIAEKAGGLTPNRARAIVGEALGERAENYEGDWGDIPIAAKDLIAASNPQEPAAQAITPGIMEQLTGQIQKAAANHDDEVVAVMKSVRALLMEMREGAGDEV